MWIKPLVIFLLLALFVSLFSGLFFFIQDQGTTRRTFHSLGLRLCIAVLLFTVTAYGLYTGELGNRVPWDPALQGQQSAKPPATIGDKETQGNTFSSERGVKRQPIQPTD